MGLREEDQPPPLPAAPATPADGVVYAQIPRTRGCVANAGIQTSSQWFTFVQVVLATVLEAIQPIL